MRFFLRLFLRFVSPPHTRAEPEIEFGKLLLCTGEARKYAPLVSRIHIPESDPANPFVTHAIRISHITPWLIVKYAAVVAAIPILYWSLCRLWEDGMTAGNSIAILFHSALLAVIPLFLIRAVFVQDFPLFSRVDLFDAWWHQWVLFRPGYIILWKQGFTLGPPRVIPREVIAGIACMERRSGSWCVRIELDTTKDFSFTPDEHDLFGKEAYKILDVFTKKEALRLQGVLQRWFDGLEFDPTVALPEISEGT